MRISKSKKRDYQKTLEMIKSQLKGGFEMMTPGELEGRLNNATLKIREYSDVHNLGRG